MLKKKVKKTISRMTQAELEAELQRCKKALGNKKLLPLSVKFYSRRRDLLVAALASSDPKGEF